jgi:hypothetical protein
VAQDLGNGRTPAAALRQWALLSYDNQPSPAAAAGEVYLLEDAAAAQGGTATRSGLMNNGNGGVAAAAGAAAAGGKSEEDGLDQQQRLLDLVEEYGQRWEVVAPLLGCTPAQVGPRKGGGRGAGTHGVGAWARYKHGVRGG